MAFPDATQTIGLLGYRMTDRITGLSGVITSVCFDLYGCVQAALHPGLDKDGKQAEQHWFDVQRLVGTDEPRVMNPPTIGSGAPGLYEHGPAEKSAPHAPDHPRARSPRPR